MRKITSVIISVNKTLAFLLEWLFSIFDMISPLHSFLLNSRFKLGILTNTKPTNSGRSLRIIREKDNLVYLRSADRRWLIPLLPCYFAQSFLPRSSHRILDRHRHHSRSCWNQLLVVFSYTNRVSTEMVFLSRRICFNCHSTSWVEKMRVCAQVKNCVMVYFWSQLRAVTWYCSRMHSKQTDISSNKIINFIVQW